VRPGDTIVAVASAPGRSVRAVVRCSGPASRSIASAAGGGGAPRTFGRGRLDLNGPSVPCLLWWAPGPGTYTGEDTAELLLPGHPALLDRAVAQLIARPGVRLAAPGEFTARAYLNGRLTVDQAEAVALTIAARNDAELAAARRLARSDGARALGGLADLIADTLALVEAGIDFADQESVEFIDPGALAARIDEIAARLDWLGGSAPGSAADDRQRVALVGRPNSGKSTLFNALLGRRRAVTSDRPGATRDALVEPLDLSRDAPGGPVVELVDLPGVDRPSDECSAALAEADLALWCDPDAAWAPIGLPDALPAIRVRTKADLPGPPAGGAVEVCALDGSNLPALRRAIADAAGLLHPGRALVTPRRAEAWRRASAAVDRARASLGGAGGQRPAPAELLAADLREALDALGDLAGRVSPDEVIGRIYATFCIGK